MTKKIDLNRQQTENILGHNLMISKIIVDGADKEAVPKGKFVFFAAFDGTNNDKDGKRDKETPYSTNVGQLWNQYEEKQKTNPRLHGGYYPGLGTKEKPWTGTWAPAAVTRGVIKTAKEAYENFAREASDWLAEMAKKKLKKKPKKPAMTVTVVLTAFSRGAASAVIFSQLLYRNGLVDPSNKNKPLIKPGKVGVTAGVLFDPVATGVKGNLAFPPNVTNAVAIKAMNEYRTMFKSVDYSKQTDIVKTFGMYGNHCDIGGGYDNGLGALSLEAATKFLQRSGLPINDVPYERERIPDERKHARGKKRKRVADKVVVHSEQDTWDVYEEDGWMYPDKRQFDTKVLIKPASTTAAGKQSFMLYDGKSIFV